MKSKKIYWGKKFELNVALYNDSVAIFPQAEISWEKGESVGYIEFKWLVFAFAITLYGRRWWNAEY